MGPLFVVHWFGCNEQRNLLLDSWRIPNIQFRRDQEGISQTRSDLPSRQRGYTGGLLFIRQSHVVLPKAAGGVECIKRWNEAGKLWQDCTGYLHHSLAESIADDDVVVNEVFPFSEFSPNGSSSYVHPCRCGGVFEVVTVHLPHGLDLPKGGRWEDGSPRVFAVFFSLQDRVLVSCPFDCFVLLPSHRSDIHSVHLSIVGFHGMKKETSWIPICARPSFTLIQWTKKNWRRCRSPFHTGVTKSLKRESIPFLLPCLRVWTMRPRGREPYSLFNS